MGRGGRGACVACLLSHPVPPSPRPPPPPPLSISFCAACINAHVDAGAPSCPACAAAGVVPAPELGTAPYAAGRLQADATLAALARKALPVAWGPHPLDEVREAR